MNNTHKKFLVRGRLQDKKTKKLRPWQNSFDTLSACKAYFRTMRKLHDVVGEPEYLELQTDPKYPTLGMYYDYVKETRLRLTFSEPIQQEKFEVRRYEHECR